MSEQQTAIDLSAFANEYDVVGEQESPDESRVFVANRKTDDARRRDDRTGVLITVYSSPRGDEANALTQFAADTGTLIGLTHRRLVPVIEGRWIGDDLYAVVTQRVTDPTLAQRLELGEDFHSTRIAAILREVNGLIEWARDEKIVHRRVTPAQVYLEPNTDRVRVSFAIAPIKRLKQPGPHDDARTIARLAVAMLGGDPEIQACDQESLQAMRPGLPELFCKATSKLLDPTDSATPADVAAFLSLISMADPLVEGETERDRIRAEILEEQRQEREKLANERTAFDAKVAEERAAFEKQMADERAAYEKAKEQERARVEAERLELQKAVTRERADLQRAMEEERAALLARRDELERTVAAQRAELERAAAKDRAEIERLRAELRAAGDQEIEKKRLTALEDITGDEESVLDSEDLATPMFGMPVLPPIEPITFNEETPLLSEEPIVLPVLPPDEPTEEERARERGAGFWANRRNRFITAGVAGVLVVGAASAMVVNGRNATPAPAPRRVVARTATAPTTAATGTALPAQPSAPVFTVDSATARSWLDSLKREHPVDIGWALDLAYGQVERAERAERARVAAGGTPRTWAVTPAPAPATASSPAPAAPTAAPASPATTPTSSASPSASEATAAAAAAAERAAVARRAAARRAQADREAAAQGVNTPREVLSQPGGVRATAPRDTLVIPRTPPDSTTPPPAR